MLQEDVVREILARLERGEKVKRVARELGMDVKTVRRWRRLGGWRARHQPERRRQVEPWAELACRRAPEVGWNAMVVHRELQALGFSGGYQQVQRLLKPFRNERRWSAMATVRFETEPGRQAQVDFGQLRLWIGAELVWVHLFVFALGFSRRLWARAYPNERVGALLDGHERAFRHFGGVPLECLYDNPRTLVIGRHGGSVLWHPVIEDFSRAYGFVARACQPYRPRTKGKVESGVKYVKRNALAGRRFRSWEHLNEWLEQWCVTVADRRVHGTTHQRPIDRFTEEQLSPLGERVPYRFERVRIRQVPADALVAIDASRYSVPVAHVGTTVSVHETATHYEIFAADARVACHPKAAQRHSVVIDPGHYAGLLRVGTHAAAPAPPRWDLAYQPLGTVAVRDLAFYERVASLPGGLAP